MGHPDLPTSGPNPSFLPLLRVLVADTSQPSPLHTSWRLHSTQGLAISQAISSKCSTMQCTSQCHWHYSRQLLMLSASELWGGWLRSPLWPHPPFKPIFPPLSHRCVLEDLPPDKLVPHKTPSGFVSYGMWPSTAYWNRQLILYKCISLCINYFKTRCWILCTRMNWTKKPDWKYNWSLVKVTSWRHS